MTRTRNYAYDAIERLTNVSVPGLPTQDEAYTLDGEGNRLSSQRSASHSTDAANRLTDDDDYTYVYDLNGNLISKLGKASTGNPDWAYRYTALDELMAVEKDGVLVESYAYDAFGRRIRIATEGGETLGIINDGADRTLDIAANDNAGTTPVQPVRRYTHSASVEIAN